MQESRTKRMIGQLGLVVATAVVTVTVAGSGVASAFNVPMNSVNSAKIVNNSVRSVDIRDGAVRSADVADQTLTRDDIGHEAIDSGLIAEGGVVSEDILNGTIQRGDLALAAQTRWAKVDADATPELLASRGISNISRTAVGNFVVVFQSSVLDCGWSATLNDNDAGSGPSGEISVERDNAGQQNVLRVRTYDSDGTPVDGDGSNGFTVSVVC
jgi:hypothetical protein